METVADQVFSWKCITLRNIPEAIYWVVEDPTGHFEKISYFIWDNKNPNLWSYWKEGGLLGLHFTFLHKYVSCIEELKDLIYAKNLS